MADPSVAEASGRRAPEARQLYGAKRLLDDLVSLGVKGVASPARDPSAGRPLVAGCDFDRAATRRRFPPSFRGRQGNAFFEKIKLDVVSIS